MRVLYTPSALLAIFFLLSGFALSQAGDQGSGRKLIVKIEPEYPETLQRLYIGGIVRLQLAITPKGNVQDVTLLGGNPILGQSAMAAVRKWKYVPAPSPTVVEVRIPFDPHR